MGGVRERQCSLCDHTEEAASASPAFHTAPNAALGAAPRAGRSRQAKGLWAQTEGDTPRHPWLIHVDVAQETSQYCKLIILQLN